ncbi:MAG TPA: rubredoxin [Methanoregulaceae archaeon]|nr:rubredoxin [Methanoregulaceae archaeon]HRY75033.1 rubredoxin [Methanoregulaceae archaeon]
MDTIHQEFSMATYMCMICGHIYDPSAGEPVQGIKAGTAFDQLADTWSCPVCSAEKRLFQKA